MRVGAAGHEEASRIAWWEPGQSACLVDVQAPQVDAVPAVGPVRERALDHDGPPIPDPVEVVVRVQSEKTGVEPLAERVDRYGLRREVPDETLHPVIAHLIGRCQVVGQSRVLVPELQPEDSRRRPSLAKQVLGPRDSIRSRRTRSGCRHMMGNEGIAMELDLGHHRGLAPVRIHEAPAGASVGAGVAGNERVPVRPTREID
jgi:hypothetical protein